MPYAVPASPRPTARPTGSEIALAFAAYQRGYYVTAFAEATRLAGEKANPKAMALLGELYANGQGVAQDIKKATEWFSFAAERGDAAASFSLAMLYLGVRDVPRDLTRRAASRGRTRTRPSGRRL